MVDGDKLIYKDDVIEIEPYVSITALLLLELLLLSIAAR